MTVTLRLGGGRGRGVTAEDRCLYEMSYLYGKGTNRTVDVIRSVAPPGNLPFRSVLWAWESDGELDSHSFSLSSALITLRFYHAW